MKIFSKKVGHYTTKIKSMKEFGSKRRKQTEKNKTDKKLSDIDESFESSASSDSMGKGFRISYLKFIPHTDSYCRS